MTEEQIALACPFCLGNCNCKACLRMDGRIKVCLRLFISVRGFFLVFDSLLKFTVWQFLVESVEGWFYSSGRCED